MAKKSIVELYTKASLGKRVDIILDNYSGFERMLNGYVQSLSVVIRNERAFNRRKWIGDTGVRVQTSNISDVTAKTAVENVSIQQAIVQGDWKAALKDTDNAVRHRREIQTICLMRDDYDIVSGCICSLAKEDYDIYDEYLSREKTYDDLVEASKLSYDAYRTKIYRCKAFVKDNAISFMEMKQADNAEIIQFCDSDSELKCA
mgnify:CR=1 FL=1